jgi:non-ribosomal peptide synthetase component F
MDFTQFFALAQKEGRLIGCPSGYGFRRTLDLLQGLDANGAVEYDGKIEDAIARAYWRNGDDWGCVSVPRHV